MALPPFGGSRVDAHAGTLRGPSVSLESEDTELSRTRYQQGSIRRVKRKKGPDVWVFRWLNTTADGSRKENNRVIGTVLEYRTKAAAEKAAEELRININSTTPRLSAFGMTFGELAEHYIVKELDFDQDEARRPKAYSTIEANRRYLQRWIVPRWGSVPLEEMEPIPIEDWLGQLGREPHKLANGTRVKMRSLMSTVFRHGMRYGFLPRDAEANPLKYVRQSGRSTKEHTILTPEQAMTIIGHLQEPVRTMVLLDASTGLRASELTGLVSACMAPGNSLRQTDGLDLRQSEDEGEETVPWKLSGTEATTDREGEGGYCRTNWLAFVPPFRLNLDG